MNLRVENHQPTGDHKDLLDTIDAVFEHVSKARETLPIVSDEWRALSHAVTDLVHARGLARSLQLHANETPLQRALHEASQLRQRAASNGTCVCGDKAGHLGWADCRAEAGA